MLMLVLPQDGVFSFLNKVSIFKTEGATADTGMLFCVPVSMLLPDFDVNSFDGTDLVLQIAY